MFRAAANPYDDIVAKATDENATSEDWGLLSTVWDKVNDDGELGAKNVVLALSKRLTHRSATVQLYALTLADALVNNCNIALHREICSKAFSQILVRMASDRNVHDKVKRRIFELVKEWVKTFEKDSSLGIMEDTLETIKKSNPSLSIIRDDNAPREPSLDLLRQEEEDIQRAIRESEALAAAPPARTPVQQPHQDPHRQPSREPVASTSVPVPPIERPPTKVKALYDFNATEEGELSFKKGDIIRVIDSSYKDWWKGALLTSSAPNSFGIFPTNYVEVLPDPTPETLRKEAEMEASVFAQAASVDRLLELLTLSEQRGDNLSENEELMELYQQCVALRPKIIRLLDKYTMKQKELATIHEKFKSAKTTYDGIWQQAESQMQQQHAQPRPQYHGYQSHPGQIPPTTQTPQPYAYPPQNAAPPQQIQQQQQQWPQQQAGARPGTQPAHTSHPQMGAYAQVLPVPGYSQPPAAQTHSVPIANQNYPAQLQPGYPHQNPSRQNSAQYSQAPEGSQAAAQPQAIPYAGGPPHVHQQHRHPSTSSYEGQQTQSPPQEYPSQPPAAEFAQMSMNAPQEPQYRYPDQGQYASPYQNRESSPVQHMNRSNQGTIL